MPTVYTFVPLDLNNDGKMSESVVGVTRNHVDDGTSMKNEAYTPPVIREDDNILRSVETVKI